MFLNIFKEQLMNLKNDFLPSVKYSIFFNFDIVAFLSVRTP